MEVHLTERQRFVIAAHWNDEKVEQLMVLQALLEWAPLVLLLHWWQQTEHYYAVVE
jgi:hypothetical protein